MGCRWQKKKLTRVMTLPYFTQNEKNVAYTSTLKISHSIQNKNKNILRSKIYLKCCHTSYSQNDRCTLGNEMKTRRIRHCWSNGEWVTKKKKAWLLYLCAMRYGTVTDSQRIPLLWESRHYIKKKVFVFFKPGEGKWRLHVALRNNLLHLLLQKSQHLQLFHYYLKISCFCTLLSAVRKST